MLTSRHHVRKSSNNIGGGSTITIPLATSSLGSNGITYEHHAYDLLVKVIGLSPPTVPNNTLFYSSKVLINRGINDEITLTEYSAPITDVSGSSVAMSASLTDGEISLHALNADGSTITVYGTRV